MKRFFFLALTILSFFKAGQAQSVAVSPYSAFGYGDKRMDNSAASLGMGGLSTAYNNTIGSEFNFLNPAANTNIRFTNFQFAGATFFSDFDNKKEQFSRSTSYLSKIALGFPMGDKFRFGLSFQPFSAVGYKTSAIVEKDGFRVKNQFLGDGGLNTVNGVLSYNIKPNFSVGLRAYYLFGNIDRSEILSSDKIQLNTKYKNNNRINGLAWSTGVFYSHPIDKRKHLDFGLTYGLDSNLTSNQEYKLTTYQSNPSGLDTPVNEEVIDEFKGKTTLKSPMFGSFGVSYVKNLAWSIGAQFDWEQTSKFNIPHENYRLNDRVRTSLGGYFIPKFNSYRSYFSRVTYRGGLFYEQTPAIVKNKAITKYGMTFGFGLPVGKANDPSEINLGIELGQRGTTANGLVKENYAQIRLSFSLGASWFQKRQYN